MGQRTPAAPGEALGSGGGLHLTGVALPRRGLSLLFPEPSCPGLADSLSSSCGFLGTLVQAANPSWMPQQVGDVLCVGPPGRGWTCSNAPAACDTARRGDSDTGGAGSHFEAVVGPWPLQQELLSALSLEMVSVACP